MEPVLLRVEEAARRLSIGRTKTYELMTAGELPVVRIGRAVRIPTAAVEAWVRKQVDDVEPRGGTGEQLRGGIGE